MMNVLVSQLGSDEVFGLVLCTLLGSCGVVCFIAYQWRKIRQAEFDASLKHNMIERGMSPAEIKLVLETGAPANRCKIPPRPVEPLPQDLHREALKLGENMAYFARCRVKQVLDRVAARL